LFSSGSITGRNRTITSLYFTLNMPAGEIAAAFGLILNRKSENGQWNLQLLRALFGSFLH